MFPRSWGWGAAAIVAALMLVAAPARAQVTTQEIRLVPGWNAVYLQVEPLDSDCATLFAQVPIGSVWAWVKRFDPVQFVTDPNQLRPQSPDWKVYFPASSPNAFLSDLKMLSAGRAYLIFLEGAEPVTLSVAGVAEMHAPEWVPDSFNFVGFPVDPARAPTFKSFFAGEKALEGQTITRIMPDGAARVVSDPAKETLSAGEAFWIYSKGTTKFRGPIAVETDFAEGLAFGERLRSQELRLVNDTATPKTVQVRLVESQRPETLPEGSKLAPSGGRVELSYRRALGWEKFESPLTLTLAPDAVSILELGVRRKAFAIGASGDEVFESLIEVTDSAGVLIRVPVTAKATESVAGLWVGTVTVDGVSEAANPADSVTTTDVPSEFRFRIIVHFDDQGTARLLQHVTLLQVKDAPDVDPRLVLVTDDSKLSSFEPIALRDGRFVGRRVTSPNFSFAAPVPFAANPGAGDADTITAAITTAFNDPLNPFVHRYHPDHNNLSENFLTTLGEGSESYTFAREITLNFDDTSGGSTSDPSAGYEYWDGAYSEKLTGLHRNDVYVSGTFRLRKVVDTKVLNDGQ